MAKVKNHCGCFNGVIALQILSEALPSMLLEFSDQQRHREAEEASPTVLGTSGEDGSQLDRPGQTAPGSGRKVGWGFSLRPLSLPTHTPETFGSGSGDGTEMSTSTLSKPVDSAYNYSTMGQQWRGTRERWEGPHDDKVSLGHSCSGPSSYTAAGWQRVAHRRLGDRLR